MANIQITAMDTEWAVAMSIQAHICGAIIDAAASIPAVDRTAAIPVIAAGVGRTTVVIGLGTMRR
ncbi:MAG: hypothetical protein ACRDUX_01710 [Mycobacterium sp.]